MCEHLLPIEKTIREKGVKELFRGEVWSKNCREWIYFDCYLDCEKLQARFSLPDFIQHHTNDDPRSGTEEGLACSKCHDALIGYHRRLNPGKDVPTVE